MFEIRLHGALWKSATDARAAEWRRTLDDLNAHNGVVAGTLYVETDPSLELVRRPDGGFEFRVYTDGWQCVHTARLAEDAVAEFFSEYDATIRQMVHVDRQAPVRGFEALDYAKRVVHDEAAAYLLEVLRPALELGLEDARRLFTLVFLVGTDLPEALVRYHRSHG